MTSQDIDEKKMDEVLETQKIDGRVIHVCRPHLLGLPSSPNGQVVNNHLIATT